jgi:hypothetical protein
VEPGKPSPAVGQGCRRAMNSLLPTEPGVRLASEESQQAGAEARTSASCLARGTCAGGPRLVQAVAADRHQGIPL